MGQLYVDAIEPQSATSLTIGESGQNTVLPGNDLRFNVIQDAGGNAIFTSNGSGTLSGVNSAFGSGMVLLNTTTISSSTAVVSFGSTLITSTYNHYIFELYNIHPSADSNVLAVNFSSDNGSTWGEEKTTTYFRAQQGENGSGGGVAYQTGSDLGNSTDWQPIAPDAGNDNDQSNSGTLHLFNPSSTTTKKVFFSRTATDHASQYANDGYMDGYVEDLAAINAVGFKYTSGTIDAGIIKLWGMK